MSYPEHCCEVEPLKIKKYVKKPVVIEAFEYEGWNLPDLIDFTGEPEKTPVSADYNSGRIFIHTLEGDMEVHPGDFVIKGIKGEFYPCRPDIFKETYEEVKDNA